MLIDLNRTCFVYIEGKVLQANLGCEFIVHLLFHANSAGEHLVPLFIITLHTSKVYCSTANKDFFYKD